MAEKATLNEPRWAVVGLEVVIDSVGGAGSSFTASSNVITKVAGDESAVPSLAISVNVTVAPGMVGIASVGATCVTFTLPVSVPLGIL